MPSAVKSSGSATTIAVDAVTNLATAVTGVSGGEQIKLNVDTTPCGANQYIEVRVKVAVRSSGSAQNISGSPFVLPAGYAAGTYIFDVAASCAYTIDIVLRGGSTARTIEWSINNADR